MEASRIPRLQRSASFSSGQIKRNVQAQMEEDLEAEDDIGSLSSVCSVVSCSLPGNSYRRAVESASEVRNQHKTTPRFALHCSSTGSGGCDQYLTPTQRANRTIRRLKALLKESYADTRYKDFEIQRLTKELVELRLEHAHCKKVGDDPHGATPSLADSGLFDDVHLNQSKESLLEKDVDSSTEKRRLMNSHVEQISDMKRQFADEMQSIRGRLTDRLEQALGQLGDSNARYASLLTSYEHNREELKRAEKESQLMREKMIQKDNCLSQLQTEIDERETRVIT